MVTVQKYTISPADVKCWSCTQSKHWIGPAGLISHTVVPFYAGARSPAWNVMVECCTGLRKKKKKSCFHSRCVYIKALKNTTCRLFLTPALPTSHLPEPCPNHGSPHDKPPWWQPAILCSCCTPTAGNKLPGLHAPSPICQGCRKRAEMVNCIWARLHCQGSFCYSIIIWRSGKTGQQPHF